MLISNQIATLLRSYPLYLYGWPFAPVSELNPNVTGTPRAARFTCAPGSASLKQLAQPLPHWWNTYDAGTDTYAMQFFNKFQRKTYNYPTSSYEMELLIARFLALPAATKANWALDWFWENGGLDHYVWANFYRVMLFGRPSTVDVRPNFSCWLPNTKIISLTTFDLHDGNYDVTFSLDTGTPYPDYHAADKACIMRSSHYIRNWDGDEEVPAFSTRRHWQRNNMKVIPQFFQVDASVDQPQSETFRVEWSSGWAADWEVSFQLHTFLATGEHGCSNWFFLPFFNTEA